MKTSSFSKLEKTDCSVQRREPRWALRITPGLEFNARAVRVRAGLLNILIATVVVLLQIDAESPVIDCILLLLLVDMVVAVLFGPGRFSPLGMLATQLVRGLEPQWTPHLPKRFAWSMGTVLAITCLLLYGVDADGAWLTSILGVFYLLTWLDAVLGFCVGCWIYTRLFGCRTCHTG